MTMFRLFLVLFSACVCAMEPSANQIKQNNMRRVESLTALAAEALISDKGIHHYKKQNSSNESISNDLFDIIKKRSSLWSRLPVIYQGSMLGHTDYIRSLAYSRDGSMLASGGNDSIITLWDTENSQASTILNHSDKVVSVAFSPVNSELASGSHDTTIKLWDLTTGKDTTQLDHGSEVRSLAYSPDGTIIASISGDLNSTLGNSTMHLWDLAAHKLIHMVKKAPSCRISAVVYHPNGLEVIVAHKTGIIEIIDLRTNKVSAEFKGHETFISSLALNSDGTRLISVAHNQAKLWNYDTKESVSTTLDRGVLSVTLSPDGNHIATGLIEKTVKIWNLATSQLITTLNGHYGWVSSVAYKPDGTQLASGSHDQMVQLWTPMEHVNSFEELVEHLENIGSLDAEKDEEPV